MYEQSEMQGFDVVALLPLLLIMVPFAIGFTLVAGRIGRNKILWAVMSLIPIINYFFWIYAGFVVLLHMLDRLNAISARTGAEAAVTARP